ncbi:MAG: TIGR03617 family F420-dependent LLM class oxidoreductase [Gammaproteobacteria bacterium]|nr:TIGR03617 family F420-dependent LLM class oxidoreductase [Gammaproteobacteria bacterium]
MKVDVGINSDPLTIAASSQAMEQLGYDGIRVSETNRDPFIPLTLAAANTKTIQLLTSVVVAFARNPLSLAYQAHELNRLANGRFVLGVGSQVKPHIERRFSMPWHKPARQMREFIGAMQAIFACWYEGERLEFDGEYYRHNLMPTTFTPPDRDPAFRPAILLSATGPLMTQVAGEVADGLITHPFSTERYLKEVTVPAVQQGLEKRGQSLESFQIDYAPMLAMGSNDEQLARAIAAVKDRIAFYGCTVAYRPVLDLHGWGALQDELIPLNRAHRRADMVSLIDDEILHTIGVVGKPKEVVSEMKRRFGGVVTRTSLGGSIQNADELKSLLTILN